MIEGALENSPARQWTLESLTEKVGDNQVHVRANTNCEDYRVCFFSSILLVALNKYMTYYSLFFISWGESTTSGKQHSKNTLQTSRRIISGQRILTWLCRISERHSPSLRSAFDPITCNAFRPLDGLNFKIIHLWFQGDFTVPPYVGKVHGGPFLWVAREGHYGWCQLLSLFPSTNNTRHSLLPMMYPQSTAILMLMMGCSSCCKALSECVSSAVKLSPSILIPRVPKAEQYSLKSTVMSLTLRLILSSRALNATTAS